MHAAMTAVMKCTEVNKIVRRLHPRTQLIRVRHPRIGALKKGQVDRILQREFDMSMMQLKSLRPTIWTRGTLAEVFTRHTELALRRLMCTLPIMVKINVMRVVFTRRMFRVMHYIAVRHLLVVRRSFLTVICNH